MASIRNRLLTTLPRKEFEGVLRRAEQVSIGLSDRLYEAGQEIESVYLPLSGAISLVLPSSPRSEIEIAVVGYEGMVGVSAVLGAPRSHCGAVCQFPAEALRLRVASLRALLKQAPRFSAALNRYAHSLCVMMAQGAVCGRCHRIEQRCARWLLITQDRLRSPQFQITHGFLGRMLGVRRAGVSEAAGRLQRRGLIRYRRGEIAIVDRAGLERASCECYGIIRNEFSWLLPPYVSHVKNEPSMKHAAAGADA